MRDFRHDCGTVDTYENHSKIVIKLIRKAKQQTCRAPYIIQQIYIKWEFKTRYILRIVLSKRFDKFRQREYSKQTEHSVGPTRSQRRNICSQNKYNISGHKGQENMTRACGANVTTIYRLVLDTGWLEMW